MASNLQVQKYMTKNPVRVNKNETVLRVCELMDPGGFRHLPVVDDNDNVVGMVTDRDLRNIQSALDILQESIEGQPGKVHVCDVMTKDVVSIESNKTLRDASVLINKLRIGGLPVIDDGKLVGIITYTDILKAVIEKSDE